MPDIPQAEVLITSGTLGYLHGGFAQGLPLWRAWGCSTVLDTAHKVEGLKLLCMDLQLLHSVPCLVVICCRMYALKGYCSCAAWLPVDAVIAS